MKIAIIGSHGVGKTTICGKIAKKLLCQHHFFSENYIENILESCPMGEVNKQIHSFLGKNFTFIKEVFSDVCSEINLTQKGQSEEITLATYSKQLYLEQLNTAQGRNIICDRSLLDTFVYYDYFNKKESESFVDLKCEARDYTKNSYDKIFLIQPFKKPIKDGDDKQVQIESHELFVSQTEIHNLFLKYTKDFENLEIVNQEDQAVDKCVKMFDV